MRNHICALIFGEGCAVTSLELTLALCDRIKEDELSKINSNLLIKTMNEYVNSAIRNLWFQTEIVQGEELTKILEAEKKTDMKELIDSMYEDVNKAQQKVGSLSS
jgi:hypothetical protein